MKVGEVMSKHVVTAKETATVRDLWKLLFAKHINAIPVVDAKKKIAGIVTKEDLLKALYPDYQEYFVDVTGISDFELMEEKVRDMGDTKIAKIMCKRVIYTRDETPVMRALSRMIVRSLNQLPVITEDDEVIGMVTKGDIFYALFKNQYKGGKSGQNKALKKKLKK